MRSKNIIFNCQRMIIALIALMTLLVASTGFADDQFYVSYLDKNIQQPNDSSNLSTFDVTSGNTFLTNFFNGKFSGYYSGDLRISNADAYGGAGGSGKYLRLAGSGDGTLYQYTLQINQPVNYFGLWISALNAGIIMQFYQNNNLVFAFSGQDFISNYSDCSGKAKLAGYCGNPNSLFLNQNPNQLYVYLNFYDKTGLFNKIVFMQMGKDNFSSDNHTVDVLSAAPSGVALKIKDLQRNVIQ